ncbi:Uu.00g118110.m01.CDS01 [Anthostomella pinea]|uniref:ubiquitinyl hydrolase 1 n=1 Tax=Anthostomella pinea TaxID=933095 RepID=A0AAI8VB48_9PEZI|nr:Uu.00g118110.m01.CDS01 [Anthostomella pinea]
MFQPQPTPFAQFGYHGLDVADTDFTDYTAFQSTPLGQFGGGHALDARAGAGAGAGIGVGSGRLGAVAGAGVGVRAGARPGVNAAAGARGGPTAADVFGSPAFHNGHQLPANYHSINSIPGPQHRHQQGQPHHRTYNHRLQSQSHNHNHNHNNHNNHLLHDRGHGRSQRRHRRHHTMEQDEMAQQEAAAWDYQPQLQGPLVGDKTSSQAITEEYAKADPTYVAKTMALPETYSHYRPIQGDGNCGWRAIAFAYFETLAQCGDVNQVSGERARLKSLDVFIQNDIGEQTWELMVDMVEETDVLFDDVITAMEAGQNPMAIITAKFNDAATSPSLIYHQRLLATAWLRANAAEYRDRIEGGIESYISSNIMVINMEIEYIGVVILCDILLKPAGMVLEIAYLDRSEGTEVNVYRMPNEAVGQGASTLGPFIYLLYRPGHYDLLYRDSQLQATPVPTGPISLQVNRATFAHHHDIQSTVASNYSTLDLSVLGMIPGGFEPSGLSPLTCPTAPSPVSDSYAHSPQSPWVTQNFPDNLPLPPSQQPTPPQQQATTPVTVHPLRFSKYNFPLLPEMAENNSSYEPAYTTNTFKNSHFNVAHYNNTNFQPEMYRPDGDEEMPSGKVGGRKRSTEHCAFIKKESRG